MGGMKILNVRQKNTTEKHRSRNENTSHFWSHLCIYVYSAKSLKKCLSQKCLQPGGWHCHLEK